MAVRRLLEAGSLDAFCFWSLPNIRYLCGFTGSDAVLVMTAAETVFLSDSRYATQAAAEVTDAALRTYRVKADGVAEVLAAAGCRRVGFESEALTVAALERLREASPETIEWVPLADEPARLRQHKTAAEIAAIESATALNAAAFEAILPLLRPGVREREIALALEFELKQRGGDEKAFDFIVASGPRGALPHGVASERCIEPGELVTIDFGIRRDGYHSDETVTIAVGTPSPELRRVFDTVLEAHDLAIAAVRPGLSLRELDALARDHIAAAGYGEYFGHGLGHGVGLEVHEAPTVSPRATLIAEEGMVITVEPGIYLPHRGGVRIEDMVLVTPIGGRVLTRIPKQLRTF